MRTYKKERRNDLNKRALRLWLAVTLLILSFGGLSVSAAEMTSGDYTYTVTNGKATITDCKTSVSGAVKIPSYIGSGYRVTEI